LPSGDAIGTKAYTIDRIHRWYQNEPFQLFELCLADLSAR